MLAALGKEAPPAHLASQSHDTDAVDIGTGVGVVVRQEDFRRKVPARRADDATG